jgi:hypothetical protein
VNEGINPSWKPLLDLLPNELHGIVTPHLKQWDSNFQAEVKKVRDEYAGLDEYKPLAEAKIPVSRVAQSLQLANSLEEDPKVFLAKINETWDLGFVDSADIPETTPERDTDGFDLGDSSTMDDLSNHPMFKQLSEQLQQVQQTFEERQQAEQEAQELVEFEKSVETLLSKEENKGIPSELVMAYMAQGFEGDEAVKRVKGFLAQTVEVPSNTPETPEAPVVMGGDGASGSGMPDGNIDFGHTMKKGAVEDVVIAMLQQSAQNNAQG